MIHVFQNVFKRCLHCPFPRFRWWGPPIAQYRLRCERQGLRQCLSGWPLPFTAPSTLRQLTQNLSKEFQARCKTILISYLTNPRSVPTNRQRRLLQHHNVPRGLRRNVVSQPRQFHAMIAKFLHTRSMTILTLTGARS